jgi:hypothetical protein
LKNKFFAAMVALVVLAACTSTKTRPNEQPVRVLEAKSILVVSAIPNLNVIPQSYGDRIGSSGRDIKLFNTALDSSFEASILESLRIRGVVAHITRFAPGGTFPDAPALAYKMLATVIPVIYCSQAKCASLLSTQDAPNIAVTVTPTEIKTNLPGSFSGEFKVTVVEVVTGTKLWTGWFNVSRYAEGRAHQQVGDELAQKILGKLRSLGFLAA